MAVIAEPKLLLLTSNGGLDPGAARKYSRLQTSFPKRRLCTLMITHNMKAALEHGNRTILMKDGRIVMELAAKRGEYDVERCCQFESDNDRMLLLSSLFFCKKRCLLDITGGIILLIGLNTNLCFIWEQNKRTKDTTE
jgi:energy-coupling factor transporter ATP-binding protein EcfA2